MRIKVIGAGLAGCEAAYQLAEKGFEVTLFEQKPVKRHPAFKTDRFAELICSNSLRSDRKENAVGLLKEECRELHSLIMMSADKHRIPAGSSLAVDREGFSEEITNIILAHPRIELVHEEVTSIDLNEPTILCAGPLCEGELAEELRRLTGEDSLYFYDAVAPIVTRDSVDFSKAYYKSRYDEGDGDYINCPMTRDEFFDFYQALMHAEKTKVRDMDKEIYFEGCMPVEAMAERGIKTLLYGPLKPVGLEKNGRRPYAVVQLRKDNAIDTLYNLVGFQTHLTYKSQKEVFSMIPGLEHAEFVRYGVMHRNSYINSPKHLNAHYQFKNYPNLFIAGQISGVEGYVESMASGLYAALSMAQYLQKGTVKELGRDTVIGSMAVYVSNPTITKLVPMNANFGIMETGDLFKKDKSAFAEADLQRIREYRDSL
ncbi:MAG: methylenetetrahydrofolate--tRNA-(uracil(54)-C(5))-methyltransferase (FADH(2)-oxidizing) TrmFO [Erysipelotrichaceae bacterium]|nr:methylenetetrahydrofolate--tRNA-(uracil(54)-C(5))-methyltransferase (FADH(2)-oxidizing) TrmFO [Erysipelotrichaceae bacterium]